MTDWRQRGACYATFNPDFFLAPGGRRDCQRAKAVCRECPVTAECLDYAMSTRTYSGIFGGLTERERRKLRKRMEAA